MFRSLGLLLCLASLTLHIRGQDDFSLNQAIDDDDVDVTKKPPAAPTKPEDGPPKPTPKPNPGGAGSDDKGPETPKPQPGGGGGGGGGGHFSNDDLIDGQPLPEDPKDKGPETPKPQPGGGGGGGGRRFSNEDLIDGQPLPEDPKDAEEKQGEGEQKNNLIAGIVGAVGAAAVGAVSSFIAYQKKKLCFKESSGDPENVNMESYKGDQAEPQVQSFLLAK